MKTKPEDPVNVKDGKYLTKRELIAIEAMNAMLSNSNTLFINMTPAGIAKAAVLHADTLINELNEEK